MASLDQHQGPPPPPALPGSWIWRNVEQQYDCYRKIGTEPPLYGYVVKKDTPDGRYIFVYSGEGGRKNDRVKPEKLEAVGSDKCAHIDRKGLILYAEGGYRRRTRRSKHTRRRNMRRRKSMRRRA